MRHLRVGTPSTLRRLARYGALVGLLLIIGRASMAQLTPLVRWWGGNFLVTYLRPSLNDDGAIIDCAPGTAGCRPLNLSACQNPPLPISFVVSPGATGLPAYTGSNQQLYAFLSTNSSCVFSTVSGQTGNNPNLLIGSNSALAGSSAFFNQGTQPFVFPSGVATFNTEVSDAGTTGTFTTHDFLNAFGACPPNVGVQAIYYLCIGVDGNGSQGVNNSTSQTTQATASPFGGAVATSTGSDPIAYLQLQVDTLPPPAPQIITSKAQNGRIQVRGSYDNSVLDIYTVNARYTKEPQNLALPCDAWTGEVKTVGETVYGLAYGEVNLSIGSLDNNVPYAVCLEAVDYLQNVSPASQTKVVTPRFECDLFACYPDTLQVGFCGGPGVSGLWTLVAAGWVGRSALRRRRNRGKA